MSRILLRRGNKVDLPVLNAGEPGFATDTKEIFVGASGGNVQAVTKLSGGAKLQSGAIAFTPTTTGNQKLGTVTFPAAFVGSPQVVISSTVSAANVNSISPNGATATAFDIWGTVVTANQQIFFSWIAVGN